jgi:hypothetical protein
VDQVPADSRAVVAVVALERDEGQALFGFALRCGLSEPEAQDVLRETPVLRPWAQLRDANIGLIQDIHDIACPALR